MPASLPAANQLIAPWRTAAVAPVDSCPDRHSIHTYFIASPESPDGQHVAMYVSTAPDGQTGELRIQQRRTGEEVARIPVTATEDAHRVACQQWAGNGDFLLFHDVEGGVWRIKRFRVATGETTVLVENRLLAFGQASCDWVPIYGQHWAPGAYRDFYMLDVRTGESRCELTMGEVREAYPEAIAKLYGDQTTSIFFPCLSPDGNRVFFKLAAPAGGEMRSSKASFRQGLFGFDRRARRLLFGHAAWGHPCWMPDSRTLLQVPTSLIDCESGAMEPIAGMPEFPGSHPSPTPDGRLFATDTRLDPFGGTRQEWGIAVGAIAGDAWCFVDRFSMAGGASSWRVPHPHPVFSADGRRLYYNRNDGPWTRLHVASVNGEN